MHTVITQASCGNTRVLNWALFLFFPHYDNAHAWKCSKVQTLIEASGHMLDNDKTQVVPDVLVEFKGKYIF